MTWLIQLLLAIPITKIALWLGLDDAVRDDAPEQTPPQTTSAARAAANTDRTPD